jgi:ribose-phosphate pyrophosphokinase
MNYPNLTMASPDTGGTRRVATYAKFLGTDFVICYKQRGKPNEVTRMALVGEVKGRDVILVDDIVDTAGTLTKAATIIMDNGANSVRAMCTHPIFSNDALERIEKSPILEMVVTDTIPLKKESKKVKVLSTASLFAEVIKRVESHESISSLFKFGE